MKPSVPYRSPSRRANTPWFATCGLIAALAATTLTACGPRDEAPLAGGSADVGSQGTTAPVAAAPAVTAAPQADPSRTGTPVPALPAAPTAALTPEPTHAPPPVIVAAAPAYPHDASAQVRRVPAAQAAPPVLQPPVVPRDRVGSVTAIEPVRQRPQGSGTGAVIGGVLGGVIGNQFGHGLGRAAMTGVGAAGGAIAGNNVERNYKTAVVGYRVHVRLDNGNTRTFQRKNIGNLHVGDRVRLDANGFRRA